MNDKTLKMIETISNVFNSISIFITGLAMLFFLLGQNTIEMFLCAGFLYLWSCGLKLIANKKKDRRLTYLGIFLIVFSTILAAFCIINMIKWSSWKILQH